MTLQHTADLKAAAIKAGVSEEDFTSFMVYCNGIYDNMGNYKGYGDTKIVPKLPVESFEVIVKESQAYSTDPETMSAIWDAVKGPVYKLTSRQKQLGLDCKGVTTYFSDNCGQEDADRINRYALDFHFIKRIGLIFAICPNASGTLVRRASKDGSTGPSKLSLRMERSPMRSEMLGLKQTCLAVKTLRVPHSM